MLREKRHADRRPEQRRTPLDHVGAEQRDLQIAFKIGGLIFIRHDVLRKLSATRRTSYAHCEIRPHISSQRNDQEVSQPYR